MPIPAAPALAGPGQPGEVAAAAPDPMSVRHAMTRQKMVTRATTGLGSVMGDPLNRYDTSIDDRRHLILGQLWAMDNPLHLHQLRPPGEPADGPLSNFFPDAQQG